MSANSLIAQLKAAVRSVLAPSGESVISQWAVLVYDSLGRQIVAPVMTTQELQEAGITLFLNLDSQKQELPGVPAVYLVEPTNESVKAIAEDCSRGLFGSYSIIFTSSASRDILEQAARHICQEVPPSMITRVLDGYIHVAAIDTRTFVPPESAAARSQTMAPQLRASVPTLLSLHQMNQQHINTCARSIMSTLLVRQQSLPFIYCPPQGPARAVGEALARMIASRNHWPFTTARPSVVLITDRGASLAEGLMYPWTYGGMVQDRLSMAGDRICLGDERLEGAGGNSFWESNALEPFEAVVEQNLQMVQRFKDLAERVSAQEADLRSVVGDIATHQREKRSIDIHTKILTHIGALVKPSRLDELHITSMGALAIGPFITQSKNVATFVELVLEILGCTAENGTPQLSPEQIVIGRRALAIAAFAELQSSMETISAIASGHWRGADPAGVEFSVEPTNRLLTALGGVTPSANPNACLLRAIVELSQTPAPVQEQSEGGLRALMTRKIKTLIASLPMTAQKLKTILSGSNDSDKNWVCCETGSLSHQPTFSQSQALPSVPAHVVVFAVGGAFYEEEAILHDIVQKSNENWTGGRGTIDFTYGGSDLLSGDELIEQLIELGQNLPAK